MSKVIYLGEYKKKKEAEQAMAELALLVDMYGEEILDHIHVVKADNDNNEVTNHEE